MNTWLRRLIPLLVVATLVVLLGHQLGANPAHEMRDVAQERLDHASPPVDAGTQIGQVFVSSHDGLDAVEVLLARYRPDEALPEEARLTLTLERVDIPGAEPIQTDVRAAGLQHNDPVRFAFPPQPDSSGAVYRLTLGSNGDYGLGFWTSSSDAYAWGHLIQNGEAQPGDLHIVTFYDYYLSDILADAGRLLAQSVRYWPALALLLLLPGITLFMAWPARDDEEETLDVWVRLGLASGASLAFWPLLLLWSSTMGWAWTPSRFAVLSAALVLLAAGLAWRRRQEVGLWLRTLRTQPEARDMLPSLALLVILLVTFATRLLQVRDLLVPAWVDSVHHTLITRLIREQGQVPTTLAPYMPLDSFHYHYGFHANAAALAWLTGLETHRAVLLMGQALNALAALIAYTLAAAWSRRRWAGVGAALVTGLVSYMPAYYVSWGRYTQLAGLLVLAPLAVVLTRLLQRRWSPPRTWALAVMLSAGLAVTHYRVLVFFLLLWPVYLLLPIWRQRRLWQGLRRGVGVMVSVGVAALLLALPWVWRFAQSVFPTVGSAYGGWSASEGVNTSLPTGLLQVGWTETLLYIAAAGAVWAWMRRRREVALLPLWCGLWLLVANLHLLGLPNIWLIHNSSVVISFWLPVSVLVGWLVGDVAALLWRGLDRLIPAIEWRPLVSYALLAAALILGGQASWRRVDAVNPVTVLVTPSDMRAIEWIDEEIPSDALFLINTYRWQGELRAGADAGWWITNLTGRRVTLPCVLYGQGPQPYREAVNALARAVEESESVDDPALIERLRQVGVTHVFVGARGGKLMPRDLDPSPHYQLRYATGPTRIYAFVPDAKSATP